MPSPVRRSRKLARSVALSLAIAALGACEFPDYAFLPNAANTSSGGAAGTNANLAGAGGGASAGTNAGGSSAAGTSSGGTAGSGVANGGMPSGGSEPIAGAAGETGTNGGTGGGLLFSDDFETSQAKSWTPTTASEWSVVSEGANHVYKEGTKVDDLCLSSAGASSWTDQILEAKVNVLAFGGSTTSDLTLLAVRYKDPDNFYYAALRSDGKVVLKARLNGSDGSLGPSISANITAGTWYDVKVTAIGEDLSVYVGGTQLQTVSGVLISSGAIAVGTNNATAEFDDVVVTAP